MRYKPPVRVTVPTLTPVSVLPNWTCAPSTGAPASSVTVPVSEPVVTPWAERSDAGTRLSARTAARPINERIFIMKALEKGWSKDRTDEGGQAPRRNRGPAPAERASVRLQPPVGHDTPRRGLFCGGMRSGKVASKHQPVNAPNVSVASGDATETFGALTGWC